MLSSGYSGFALIDDETDSRKDGQTTFGAANLLAYVFCCKYYIFTDRIIIHANVFNLFSVIGY